MRRPVSLCGMLPVRGPGLIARPMTRDPRPIAALGLTSFVCPYCGALAQQQWGDLYVEHRDIDEPALPADRIYIESLIEQTQDLEGRVKLRKIAEAMLADNPAILGQPGSYVYHELKNVFISKCFSCKEIAIWLQGRLIYPSLVYEVEPNADLPIDVLAEFNEAALIMPLSPRGAAALLRLAIQRLCNFLGKSGDINQMIGELVSDGLDVRVQKALDIVRVIGNESVHPGTIDVRDTPEVAKQLFSLVNLIAEKTISEPKHIDELYSTLPAEKLSGIEQRNAKALGSGEKT